MTSRGASRPGPKRSPGATGAMPSTMMAPPRSAPTGRVVRARPVPSASTNAPAPSEMAATGVRSLTARVTVPHQSTSTVASSTHGMRQQAVAHRPGIHVHQPVPRVQPRGVEQLLLAHVRGGRGPDVVDVEERAVGHQPGEADHDDHHAAPTSHARRRR